VQNRQLDEVLRKIQCDFAAYEEEHSHSNKEVRSDQTVSMLMRKAFIHHKW